MKSKLITSLDNSDKKKIFNDWNTLLKSFKSPFALYATPTWFETLHDIDPSNYILGISETEEGQIQSIIPIEIKSKELIFSIYRKNIFKYKFNCAYVLGGEPLGIIPSEEYGELFKKLIKRIKQAAKRGMIIKKRGILFILG